MSRSAFMPFDLPAPGRARPPRGRPASRGGRCAVGNGRCPAGCRGSRRSRWGVAREMVQGEHDALVGRQPPEPAFELVPVGDREELVGRGRSVDRQHPEVGHATPFPARLADADVDQELLEPRVEPVRIAERPQVTPGDHQRILEGILGPVDVAEDPLCDREQPIARGRTRSTYASRSPRWAASTRSRSTVAPLGAQSGAPSNSTGRDRAAQRSGIAKRGRSRRNVPAVREGAG